jgi:prolipoprotein diacylglyceryltransferase
MKYFYIDTSNGGIWFSLIYLFVFMMVISVFIIKGVKSHHRLVSLWLIAVTGMFFFIAGTELFPLSLNDWELLLRNGAPYHSGEKSVLGGILGFGGFVLAIYWLKERIAIIDNMAVVFVIGIGIQNLSCLKAGCCFGTTTTLPWAVEYDRSSPAFYNQLKLGAVQLTDTVSLPLHPVQLYLMAGCMVIAFIVWKTRNLWKAPISLFLFGWILYTVLRFVVEFLRDPVTDQGAGYIVFGSAGLCDYFWTDYFIQRKEIPV